MAEVFEGITVLDFTRGMPGSIATMVLSDFGAEVIKVEPPGGDPFRDWPGAIQSNRGKKSVVLDLKSADGLEKARRLSAQADVVVESFRPGVTKRLGIDYETLGAGRPELVYASLTGFGPKGPYANYKGYDAVVTAKGGRMMMFARQNPRPGPNYLAVQSASHSAATALVRGITAALFVRERTGRGQLVEVNILKTITTHDHLSWIQGQMTAKDPVGYPQDPSMRIGRPNPTGYLPVRTKDGRWMQLGNIVERLFRSMVHWLDMDYIYEDPRYKNAPDLAEEDVETLEQLMFKRLQEKSLDEWMDMFVNQTSDVAAEPYMTSEEALDHPQIVHNGHSRYVDDPRVGRTRQIGPMVMMRDTPGGPKGPAPDPGQHTDEVLGSLNGRSARPTNGTGKAMPEHALEGITVLDLGTVINGPLGCALVAEFGARVIRIEAPDGDWGRHSSQGLSVHRTMAGSEDICLNLKTPEGQEIMHKLAAKADMLLHSMRPGAPERTGIGYEQLTKINPNLVYLYAGGYGSTGPYNQRPSMAPIAGAVCGGGLAQLGRDTVLPAEQEMAMDEIVSVARKLKRSNDGGADHNTAMVNSVGLMMGLYVRERTGKAQYVESTMLAGNAYANADDFYWHQGKPPRRLPDADGYGLNALYRLYHGKTGWVFLACPFEEEWRAFCRTIARDDLLADPRFASREAREANDDALIEELQRVFSTKDPLEWEALLTAADVACVKAEDRSMYEFYSADPHIRENGFTTEVDAARDGKFWRYTPVVTLSETPGKVGPGPLKGQHTRPILRELGYSEEQIRDFKERGVVDWDEG